MTQADNELLFRAALAARVYEEGGQKVDGDKLAHLLGAILQNKKVTLPTGLNEKGALVHGEAAEKYKHFKATYAQSHPVWAYITLVTSHA